MASRVLIYSDSLSSESIAASLSPVEGRQFQLRVERTRGIQPSVLVAVVGAAGTALGALITGVLKLANEHGARRIVVHGSSGRQVEFPTGLPDEEVQKLVALAKEIDVNKITL